MPNMTDPTLRNISTRVIPHVMSVLDFPKAFASWGTVSETVKKSNASHVCGGWAGRPAGRYGEH